MTVKLFDSEPKAMDVLWKEGDKTAKQISEILKKKIGIEAFSKSLPLCSTFDVNQL